MYGICQVNKIMKQMNTEKKQQPQGIKNKITHHIQTQSSRLIGSNNNKIQTFPELTYSRRRKEDDKKISNPEAQRPQEKKLQIEKRVKMPVLFDGTKYASTRTIGRSGSLSLLESLLNKSQISPLQKQRRHYNFVQSQVPVQRPREKRQNKKISFQVSQSKYRKIILDYQHHCDFNGNRQGKYYEQKSLRPERKKSNYRQNLFKQSIDLNIEAKKNSQRKPCLTRNQSSICLY